MSTYHTPLFDQLVADCKQRFKEYDGPETFPDTGDATESGKLTAFDHYHAVDAVMSQLDPKRLLAVILEIAILGGGWWSFPEDMMKKFPMPPSAYASLISGSTPNISPWPSADQLKAIHDELLRTDTDLYGELVETLTYILGEDPKIKGESERRWALTGRGEDG